MKKQLLFKDRHQRGQGPSAGLYQLQEQKCFLLGKGKVLEVLPMEALEVLLVVLDLVMVVLEVLLEVVWVAARQLAEQFQNSQLLMELVRGTRLILLCRLLVLLLPLLCLA